MPKKCGVCGHINPEDADFCVMCAADLSSPDEVSDETPCSSCGTSNPIYAKFCKKCAEPLSGANDSSSQASLETDCPMGALSPSSTILVGQTDGNNLAKLIQDEIAKERLSPEKQFRCTCGAHLPVSDEQIAAFESGQLIKVNCEYCKSPNYLRDAKVMAENLADYANSLVIELAQKTLGVDAEARSYIFQKEIIEERMAKRLLTLLNNVTFICPTPFENVDVFKSMEFDQHYSPAEYLELFFQDCTLAEAEAVKIFAVKESDLIEARKQAKKLYALGLLVRGLTALNIAFAEEPQEISDEDAQLIFGLHYRGSQGINEEIDQINQSKGMGKRTKQAKLAKRLFEGCVKYCGECQEQYPDERIYAGLGHLSEGYRCLIQFYMQLQNLTIDNGWFNKAKDEFEQASAENMIIDIAKANVFFRDPVSQKIQARIEEQIDQESSTNNDIVGAIIEYLLDLPNIIISHAKGFYTILANVLELRKRIYRLNMFTYVAISIISFAMIFPLFTVSLWEHKDYKLPVLLIWVTGASLLFFGILKILEYRGKRRDEIYKQLQDADAHFKRRKKALDKDIAYYYAPFVLRSEKVHDYFMEPVNYLISLSEYFAHSGIKEEEKELLQQYAQNALRNQESRIWTIKG